MYERTAKHVSDLRKAEQITFLSATVRDKLDESLKKAARYCISTQQENGAWMVVPDPRVFETALISYALGGASRGECKTAVARTQKWLRTADYQHHSHLAYLIEEAVRFVCLGKRITMYEGEAVNS
jgi:hypothetical protein